MGITQPTDTDQRALWNGRAGEAWVDTQELLDAMFQPFADLLVEAVRAASAKSVLDVGCGTGATTLEIARRTGARGLGIDISEPMIARARTRIAGAPAEFVCGDAQTYAFQPAAFDMVVSRFGVMFFDDPVRAFRNLRQAASEGATMQLIAWRGPDENPFMTAAERAAAPFLPDMPARRAGAPGQFAFADPERVRDILGQSGWSETRVAPLDVTCTFPESELMRYVTRLGPVGVFLADVDASARGDIVRAVREAFEPYVQGSEVRYTAACWRVEAR